MKLQEVNFLRSIVKPPNQLPALTIGISCIGISIILIIISLITGFYQFQRGRSFDNARIETIKAETDYQQLVKTYPLLSSEKELVEKVANFEKLVAQKRTSYAELTHTTLRKPFSKFMEALAKTVPEGLWLNVININQDSGNISLAGYAVKPVFVTAFLQKLEEVSPFTGTAFDIFEVNFDKESGYIKFEVANDKLLHND